MARVLIGWELGGGSGHHIKIASLAETLLARGHVVAVAAQDVSAAPAGCSAWQAPVWPGQLVTRARAVTEPPATMGDILVRLGLTEDGAMRAMLAGWDSIIASFRPDAVLAEYAPALMLAARGRVPVLATGTGFSLPPAHLDSFPAFGEAIAADERPALAALNRELVAAGRAPLDGLPAIFAGDRTMVSSFAETDPYRGLRQEGDHVAPSIGRGMPPPCDDGEEVFVYMRGSGGWLDRLWAGLAASGLRIRLYHPLLGDADTATLERAGLTVERRPVPFDRIAERSRLVLSHGGLGFASSALLCGLPQIIVYYDVEKQLIAQAIDAGGAGRGVRADRISQNGIAGLVRELHGDTALHARTRAAAPGYRQRMSPTVEEASAAWIEGLC
jgi:rhamnosyltransferase subunit B